MKEELVMTVSEEEMKSIVGKEAITIALVATVLVIGILTIAIWKFYVSNKGKVELPGGFKFEWSALKCVSLR